MSRRGEDYIKAFENAIARTPDAILTAFRIDPYILDVTTGALIIFAVALDMLKSRKKA